MPDPSQDFTPIRDDYEFFVAHATEADADLKGYEDRLRTFTPSGLTLRMLDFGCGPGSFTARFLGRTGWEPERLDLSLVEPSVDYRQDAVARLGLMTDRPIRAWPEQPAGLEDAFDVVLTNHVLYFVPELETTLARLLQALAPGGLFLTTIAGRDNVLIDFWFQAFPRIREPVPFHIAEDVDAVLTRLGQPFERQTVGYTLDFPDTHANRQKILRFMFGHHLADMPEAMVLELFDPYVAAGRVEIPTHDVQFSVHAKGSSRSRASRGTTEEGHTLATACQNVP